MPITHPTEKLLKAVNLLFVSEIIPNLPEDKIKSASMILKGLEIAIRNSRIKESSGMQTKSKRLPQQSSYSGLTNTELDDISHKLRNGNFDDDLLGPIFQYLEKEVSSRLLKSNPDFVNDKKFSQFSAG